MSERYLEDLAGREVDVRAHNELLDLYLEEHVLDIEKFADEQVEQWQEYVSKIDLNKPRVQGLPTLYALLKFRQKTGLDTRLALAYFTEALADHILAEEGQSDV